MASNTAKIAYVMFENALEHYSHQTQLLPLCDFREPDPKKMQVSNNVYWEVVQQHAQIITGWDLTGQEGDIIEEAFPIVLGDPSNDFVKVRADDLRDPQFWERRGAESGKRQATELNKAIADVVALQGSQFYRTNVTNGYDFIGPGQAILNERQLSDMGRCFVLNDRSTLKFASDLSARQTLQGRPESEAWAKGQIGGNVAEFDVYTGSFLPSLAGGADPATTVTGDQSFAPEPGTVTLATGIVQNNDYRLAAIPVAASAAYNVGDKVQFANGGTPVEAIGLADKTLTGQPFTATIVGKPDATTIQIYPKPIAADDPALTASELAYANVNTRILNTATVNRLNIDASAKTNLFWDKDAVRVTGGTIPADLFAQFDGMKVIQDTMENGLTFYMVYDGNIDQMTFRFRIFAWWGVTMANPQAAGVAISF